MTATITRKLPALEATYQVTQNDITEFAKNGYARINNICSKSELNPFREELQLIVDEFKSKKAPLSERDLYGKAFLQISNIWEKSQQIKKFVLAKRFGKIAADLMGVNAVRLYHDQALYKEAGGGHTPWHQDQYYWPTEGKTITMWMPLVDASREMGLMEFIPNKNKSGMLANVNISESSDIFFKDLLKNEALPVTTFDYIEAGSATFHCGWTPHRAGPNTTDKLREVMTIIFIEDGAVVSTPKTKGQESDLKSWFPGLKVGDKAASPLNTLCL
jgi:ectoine hydroxylase-related dioxygenase (phytanoyl-CoA dioxygenase family)